MVLTVALATSCVPKEEKPAETKAEPAAPAGPPPEPARAALAIKPEAAYTIVGAASGKCLQLVGAGDGDTARTEIASCNGSKAQQFKFQSVPGNYWAIVNVLSSKCVDVSAFDHGRRRARAAVPVQRRREPALDRRRRDRRQLPPRRASQRQGDGRRRRRDGRQHAGQPVHLEVGPQSAVQDHDGAGLGRAGSRGQGGRGRCGRQRKGAKLAKGAKKAKSAAAPAAEKP